MDNFPSKVRFFCKKISLKPMSSKLNRVDQTFLTLSVEYCHFQTERSVLNTDNSDPPNTSNQFPTATK